MEPGPTLAAADGLTLHLDPARWGVAWGESDWLGPIGLMVRGCMARPRRFDSFNGHDDLGAYHGVEIVWEATRCPLRASVRAYAEVPVVVFRLGAEESIEDMATGSFAQPTVAWPICHPAQRARGGVPEGTRSYGHQYTEFALPVSGDEHCTGFTFAPHRPPVVEPLLFIAPDGRTLLLAPWDHFHEQIIAVPESRERVEDGVRCGWHGDLDAVPAGFATELAIWAAVSPRQALETWGTFLQRRYGTQRPSRYTDDLVGKLSYWTDNGAVYYYRTEPECDYSSTLERVVADLRTRDVPVRSLQIDSWFYPHQHLRPVSSEGAPIVPPSGMMTWAPRADVFPGGLRDLQTRIGGLPLTCHSRHFSSRSPYFEHYAAWSDGEYAHPADPALFDLLMASAASWGAITYEQDWMVESFLGVRGLRAAPGRARAWQEQLDCAARAHGLHLQWCMATPADFLQTVSLRQVASIRTSGDYRYLFDNGLNWTWFLHTNALARALGLTPFKDVFLSHGKTTLSDGEPYAEVEALLASLSAGPVAIGDQLGCTNRDLVMRTCRDDGVLIKPDVPLAAVDRCFRANSFFEPAPLLGECYSLHPAGRWIYVASFNAWRGKKAFGARIDLTDLGAVRPLAPVLAYDWRRRTWTRLAPDEGWEVTLPFQEWDYRVLCPLLPGDVTVFGDVSKYATVGDRRVANITASDTSVHFDLLGTPDTTGEVHGYAAARPREFTVWVPGTARTVGEHPADGAGEGWCWEPATGGWKLRVVLGPLGRTRVSMSVS
jgi:hypothetical protein